MAFSSSYLPTQTLFSVLFLVFTMFFLLQAREGNAQLLDTNYYSFDTNYYSFDVNNFSQTADNFTLRGNAQILPNGILVLTSPTCPNKNASQVLYSTAIPIWNKNTGETANFVSTFSFVLKDNESYNARYGEPIFFLVGENCQQEDPTCSYIGINVSSRNWLNIVPSTRRNGSLIKVVIRYSSRKRLTVTTTDIHKFIEFHQVVNLKDVLPEMVKIGISTAQMEGRQTHDIHIHSWSFYSNFISTTSMARGINIDIASYALLFFIYFMHEWLL